MLPLGLAVALDLEHCPPGAPQVVGLHPVQLGLGAGDGGVAGGPLEHGEDGPAGDGAGHLLHQAGHGGALQGLLSLWRRRVTLGLACRCTVYRPPSFATGHSLDREDISYAKKVGGTFYFP